MARKVIIVSSAAGLIDAVDVALDAAIASPSESFLIQVSDGASFTLGAILEIPTNTSFVAPPTVRIVIPDGISLTLHTGLYDVEIETVFSGAGDVVIDSTPVAPQVATVGNVADIGTVAQPGALRLLIGSDGDVVLLAEHSSSGDGGGGFFRWVDDLAGDSDNGMRIAVTGSSGGWVRVVDAGSPINVRWFGCSPGVSSAVQSAQAQEALTYAVTNERGTLLWPSGVYTLTVGLVIPDGANGLDIVGESRGVTNQTDGTKIVAGTTGMTMFAFEGGAACRCINFRNLWLCGNFKANIGIWASRWYESTVEHVHFNQFLQGAIYGQNLVIVNVFKMLKINDCRQYAIYLGSDCNRNTIGPGCRIAATRSADGAYTAKGLWFYTENQIGNNVLDNYLESNDTAIFIDGAFQSGCSYNIERNSFENNSEYDIYVATQFAGRRINQVRFVGNAIAGTGAEYWGYFDGVQHLFVQSMWNAKWYYKTRDVVYSVIDTDLCEKLVEEPFV